MMYIITKYPQYTNSIISSFRKRPTVGTTVSLLWKDQYFKNNQYL